MKKRLARLREHYFADSLDFRVLIFNTLGLIGVVTGVAFAVISLLTRAGAVTVFVNLAATAFALALMALARRTGRYRMFFLATVVVVFLVMFPVLFFAAGGYHSGMPAFFVFAVAFTVLMLEGRTRVVVTALELLLYLGICAFAYQYPESVTQFASEREMAFDIISSCLIASLMLALAIGQHIVVYDRKQRRLEELDREKTELFGNISHEMKTPLAVLSAYAQGLKDKLEPIAEAEGAVASSLMIVAEAERLALLVTQVLELTQISEGRMECKPQPCNIDEILHRAITSYFAASLNGNRIDVRIDAGLPLVMADAARVAQVVINLAANADRHTRNGNIVIAARRARGFVAVSVQDNGDGIAKERLPLIFERYHTGAGDTGTGLGLYICRYIVEAHGGRITAESEQGKGALFTFTLPVHSGAQ